MSANNQITATITFDITPTMLADIFKTVAEIAKVSHNYWLIAVKMIKGNIYDPKSYNEELSIQVISRSTNHIQYSQTVTLEDIMDGLKLMAVQDSDQFLKLVINQWDDDTLDQMMIHIVRRT